MKPMYEFTVSDEYGKSQDDIAEMARRSVEEQAEFEYAMGCSWPAWKVVLVKTVYHFEVQEHGG